MKTLAYVVASFVAVAPLHAYLDKLRFLTRLKFLTRRPSSPGWGTITVMSAGTASLISSTATTSVSVFKYCNNRRC
jgi:hypothetical protein